MVCKYIVAHCCVALLLLTVICDCVSTQSLANSSSSSSKAKSSISKFGTRKPLVLSKVDSSTSIPGNAMNQSHFIENKISSQRNLITQFISDDQASKIIDVLKLKYPYFTEQYNGTFVYGCEQLLYGYGESQTQPRMKQQQQEQQQHRMSRQLKILIKNFLEVTRKISDYAESFFDTALQVESCVFNIRKTPGMPQYLPFARMNVSRWTHGVHVDQCQLDFAFTDRVECRESKLFKANRHFTAVLYLHEVEGGNFAFVDLPRNHSFRSLADIPAPSNLEIKEAIQRARRRKILASSSSSDSISNRRLEESSDESQSGEYYLTREGIFTVVPPAPGKLVLFTSGAENMHGVTDLLSPVRYTLSLWFTRANK